MGPSPWTIAFAIQFVSLHSGGIVPFFNATMMAVLDADGRLRGIALTRRILSGVFIVVSTALIAAASTSAFADTSVTRKSAASF